MNTATIPFHLLKPVDEINARAGKSKDGLEELAASIAAKGLIQPLAVREDRAKAKGFEIIDGRRRYMAMQKLVKAGTWDKQHQVPVLIREDLDDAEALETSLMANTVRLPMHPVDQYAVFARLVEKGSTTPQIAERFGIAERTVKQHMALAALAPEIRDAWRKGKIDQKVAQRFTLSPNHDVQAAAYKKLSKQGQYGLSDHNIRHELANDRPKASAVPDDLLQAYTAAGGTISESLFEDERYIDDGALLRKVRHDAREPLRQKWLSQGWGWVKFHDEIPPGQRWKWRDLGLAVEYTAEEARRLNEIEDADWSHDLENGEDAIRVAAGLRAFTPELRAKCGVIIDDDLDDQPMATFGLVDRDRNDDADEFDAGDDADDEDDDDRAAGGEGEAEDDEPAHTGAMIMSLTTSLTIACQRVLASDPSLALRVAVAALTADMGHDRKPSTLRHTGYGWLERGDEPPKTFRAVIHELEDLPAHILLERFAPLIAASLDMKAHHHSVDRRNCDALRDLMPGEAYLEAAREIFIPADFFDRAPKHFSETALDEMRVAYGKGAKKAELAQLAAREAKDLGWLPPELRHPTYKLLDPSASTKSGRKGKAA